MIARILALLRASFAAQWGSGGWPAAPLVTHGTVAAVVCGLVSDVLPAYAYALVALSASAALVALPLLGEFAPLLRADSAGDWLAAQPVRRSEIRIARTLLMLASVGALAFAALLPAVWFAPDEVGWSGRIALFAAGLGQAIVVAAALLTLQAVLGERAEALLVLLQTALFASVAVGLLVGLRHVPALLSVVGPGDLPRWATSLPPAWFAVALASGAEPALAALPWLATLLALLALAFAPPAGEPRARGGGGPIAAALAPLRAVLSRTWVRTGERASFDLVYDALPLEREFVLRTYPLVGVPLAFLVAGARGEPGSGREALLALLLFTPAIYLPVLLVHVPASASASARWLLDTAPVGAREIAAGARKAVALRFVVPLYLILFAAAWSQAGFAFALRLALPAALLSIVLLRHLYAICVVGPPLSTKPDDVVVLLDWTGPLLMLAMGLTIAAVLAWRFVTTIELGLALSAALVALEIGLDRLAPRGDGDARSLSA